jgi:membrane-associated phospholipid phosphatase
MFLAAPQRGVMFWLLVMPLMLTPPYAISNRLEWFPAYEVPRVPIDEWVPFMPELALLYLGLFPLMWIAVLVQPDVSSAKRMVLSAAGCAWVVSVIFVFYPTTFARPPGDPRGFYALVVGLDTPRNACPSLHGTYAALSAAWIAQARGWSWGIAATVIAFAVLVATVAVRQHGSIDLALGAAIGLVAFVVARPRSLPPASTQEPVL